MITYLMISNITAIVISLMSSSLFTYGSFQIFIIIIIYHLQKL
jgi:hypothetical protein